MFPPLYRFEAEYGSLIRGAIRSRSKLRKQQRREGGAFPDKPKRRASGPSNFTRGMVALTGRLAAALGDSARHSVEVFEISRKDGALQIFCSEEDSPQTFDATAVVVATPTMQASKLLAGLDPRFAAAFAGIEYASVAQVSSGYSLDSISLPAATKSGALHGFGFLVPRSERRRLLGTVWSSALFPGRTPAGPEKTAAFTSFLGGALDPGLCRLSETEIAQIAHDDLASVLGIQHPPLAEHVTRWERAIPQYNLGHGETVEKSGRAVRQSTRDFLAGNYLSGPALPACVAQANRTAEEVERFCAALPSQQ